MHSRCASPIHESRIGALKLDMSALKQHGIPRAHWVRRTWKQNNLITLLDLMFYI